MKLETDYFAVPNKIFDFNLTLAELTVLIYLIRSENQKDKSWSSFQTIATKCHISRITAIRTINSLSTYNFIDVLHSRGHSNTYKVRGF